MALNVDCCETAKRPKLGAKRTLRGHRGRLTHLRTRLVRWPREVLAEFGLALPPEVEIRIEDSNQKCRFMVLPVRPKGTEKWTEQQLAAIVTREICMIGVALPRPGRTEDVHPIHKARRPVQSSPHHGRAAE